MSTVDHLIAACGSLRTAWGWLATATTPGRGRRNQRQLSDTAKARQDKQAAAERNDRHQVLTSGRVPTGNTNAPANLNAIDARGRIAEDIDTQAWLMASAMRNDKYTARYRPDGRSVDHRFLNALDWISLNAPRLHNQATIDDTHQALDACDRYARSLVGEGPGGRHLAAGCLACGRRSLVWDTTSTDYREWHIRCDNKQCRCDGRNCACNMPERQPGLPHVWLESAWNRLAQQLNDKEAV